MILISHRGNISGKKINLENKPEYIKETLSKGYDVEIDVWFTENQFYLGHDVPQYKIDYNFLLNEKLWCHAKNIDALIQLEKISAHYFWHENDTVTLTSKKIIWAYPSKIKIENAINVLPEMYNIDVSNCMGICSDYVEQYK